MKINYFAQCETLDDAKKLYRKLAFELHPDKGGKTKDFQDLLDQFQKFRPANGKEKYQGEFDDWEPAVYAEIVNQLLKINGINVVVCGSWIWLEGDTRSVKDQIKAVDCGDYMKRGWSKSKSQWYFSPKGYRKKSRRELSFEDIKGYYGATYHKNANGEEEENKPRHRKLNQRQPQLF